MPQKLICPLPLLLLLTTTIIAQSSREPGPSLQKRAQSLEPLIIESARRYGLDPRVVSIVCFLESRYQPTAISPKGARGPMQFMPATALRYGLLNPQDPRASIDAGAHYLRDLLMKFGGRLDLALAAYNAGEGTVESFRTGRPLVLTSGKIINPRRRITGGVPPYLETQQYVKSGVALFLRASDARGVQQTFHSRMNSPALPQNRNKNKGTMPSKTKKVASLFIEVQ
jgi:soluble lytic murein transglycosylase-like protein